MWRTYRPSSNLRSTITPVIFIAPRAVRCYASTTSKLPEHAETIQTAYKAFKRARYTGAFRKDTKRVHVLSEDLCDDILERMKPSLQRHKGCDIIDVNPGPGVWSARLHDFLQPRSHILMEPDHELYGPMLQPLLDAQDSKYRMVSKSGVVWDHLNTVLSPEYLPHQTILPQGDARLDTINDSLLFVANLGYYPKKPYRGFSSLTLLTIHQLVSAIRSHSLFHKYGLVRMLIWCHDEEKKMILPRTITLRKKFTVECELSCESLVEVASSTVPVGDQRRDYERDLVSMQAVLKRMEAANIETPQRRRGSLMEDATNESPTGGSPDATKAMREFYQELHVLKQHFASGKFQRFIETPEEKAANAKMSTDTENEKQDDTVKEVLVKVGRGRPKGKAEREMAAKRKEERQKEMKERAAKKLAIKGRSETPEYKRMKILTHRYDSIANREKRFNELIAEEKILTAAKLEPLPADPKEAAARTQELAAATQAWLERVEEVDMTTHALFWLHADNERSLVPQDATLYWDRRPYEPLLVDPGEFFPHTSLCLLDFTPRALWPILRENNPANYDVLEYILSQIFGHPTQSVLRGLESCAPGAVDWLVPRCPSLRDPARGGALDLELLSVRCLTLDMLREIMTAWMVWPFRPTRFEVLGRLGSEPYDAHAET